MGSWPARLVLAARNAKIGTKAKRNHPMVVRQAVTVEEATISL